MLKLRLGINWEMWIVAAVWIKLKPSQMEHTQRPNFRDQDWASMWSQSDTRLPRERRPPLRVLNPPSFLFSFFPHLDFHQNICDKQCWFSKGSRYYRFSLLYIVCPLVENSNINSSGTAALKRITVVKSLYWMAWKQQQFLHYICVNHPLGTMNCPTTFLPIWAVIALSVDQCVRWGDACIQVHKPALHCFSTAELLCSSNRT